MDSSLLEEDLVLPFSEEPSPVRPKLKRLKRASSQNHSPLIESEPVLLPDSDEPLFPESGGLIEELRKENEPLVADSEEQELEPLFPESGGLMEELRKEKMDQMEGEYEDSFQQDGLDPLFSEPSLLMEELRKERMEETRVRVSDSPQMEDGDDGLDPLFPESGEYKAWEGEEIGEGGLIEDLKQERSAKKRLNWDDDEEIAEQESKMKKKMKKKEMKKKSGEDGDSKPKESAKEKRRLEKERRVQLDMLHAETQRLLRETSDASFKPIPVVHKPISSVLEKIRLRKMQILKQSSISLQTESLSESECSDAQNVKNDDMDVNMGETRADENNLSGCENNDENASRKSEKDENHSENASRKTEKIENHSENATKDEENCENSQLKNKESIESDDSTDNNNETEKVLSSSPDLDSDNVSPSSDDEDEEEDNDKENIDPHLKQTLSPKTLNPKTKTLNPKSSHLKEFLDDEAEEEDDSDNDLMRFKENDNSDSESEEENVDENEEFKDLIATGFKEGKRDKERRNELHLKWMQEQDNNITTRVLQKLKFGKEEEEEEDLMDENEIEEEGEEERESEEREELGFESKKSILKKHNEKLRQMMVKMFDDDDDVYVSSDDDETEEILLRQRFALQKEDSKLISPLEDEHSKEVFGLIKNLNIAPPPKRAKHATSNLNMLTLGGTSNIFSKSSFIGRKTSSSLPTSRKVKSAMSRAFIFERDDSNSRSSLSSENQSSEKNKQSDVDASNESHKPSSAKLTSSQFKPPSINTNSGVNSNSNSSSSSSLFQILRQSSVNLGKTIEQKQGNGIVRESQAAYQFSAFKLTRRFSRVEGRN